MDAAASGRAALAANRLEDATNMFEQAIRINPEDADLHNCLGIALSRQGQHTAAIGSFSRAVQLSPNNSRYWHNLGAAHQTAQHPLKAARYYQVAIRLLPTYELARTSLHSLSKEHPSLRISTGSEIPVKISADDGILSGFELSGTAAHVHKPNLYSVVTSKPEIPTRSAVEPQIPPEFGTLPVIPLVSAEEPERHFQIASERGPDDSAPICPPWSANRGVDLETIAAAMTSTLVDSAPVAETAPVIEPVFETPPPLPTPPVVAADFVLSPLPETIRLPQTAAVSRTPEVSERAPLPEVCVGTARAAFDAKLSPGSRPGVLTRFTAALIDLLVIQTLWVVMVIVVNAVQRAIPSLPEIPNGVPVLLGALSGLIYVVSMTHWRGCTLGKSLLHLKVVVRSGDAPGLFRSGFRTLFMPLSAAVFGLGYFWLEFDRRGQALHDKITSTYVTGRKLDPGAGLIIVALVAALNWGLFAFLRIQLFA